MSEEIQDYIDDDPEDLSQYNDEDFLEGIDDADIEDFIEIFDEI